MTLCQAATPGQPLLRVRRRWTRQLALRHTLVATESLSAHERVRALVLAAVVSVVEEQGHGLPHHAE